ncbi:unnamed protein product [Closterium sp. Naga37s-1]|nr:unnamed protein product [Closterium sp. Naga37s-1]
MPSLASRARSAQYTKLPPSALLSWRLPSISRRLSLSPPVPTAASADRASSALPTCWFRTVAASLATVTRCLPSCCAAGGALASAVPLRTSPSAGGARRASGTRCCPSSLSALAVPASAPRCCVPRAADRGAPATKAPLRAFLLGARAAQMSAAHPSICRRAPTSAPANACRRRSSLPAPDAYHTGGSRLRTILRGADPCPACATAPPSLCQAAFAPVCLERPCLVSLAPGEPRPPMFSAHPDLHEVDTILSHRDNPVGREYLIHWRNTSASEDSWEPFSNLSHAPRAIGVYLASLAPRTVPSGRGGNVTRGTCAGASVKRTGGSNMQQPCARVNVGSAGENVGRT